MAQSEKPKDDKKKPTKSDIQSEAEKGLDKGLEKCLQKGIQQVMVKGAVDEVFKGLQTKRRITIKIYNNTKRSFDRGSVHFKSGTSDDLLKETIKSNEHAVFCARKTNLSLCIAGCVGVIGYQIEATQENGEACQENRTLAIYFRVPYFNHLIRENKWNVMLVNEKKVDEVTFKKLSESKDSISGNMCWVEDQKIKISESGNESEYTFSGCMSSSAKSTLEVHISDGSTFAEKEPNEET